MNNRGQKSDNSNKQENVKVVTTQKKATAKRRTSSSRNKVQVVYEVQACESIMQNKDFLAEVDKVVESNKPLKEMIVDRHFLVREHPINIGKFAGQIKEFEILTRRENDVLTGFSLFKRNVNDEWSVSWMVVTNGFRNVKRMYELFSATLVAGRGFGAKDLKFDLYLPEWKSEDDIYDFFSRGSGNRVSMVTKDAIFVKVNDFSYGCPQKPIIGGLDLEPKLDEKDTKKH